MLMINLPMITGDQTSMLVRAAIVLQRVLTLTWSPTSVIAIQGPPQFDPGFSGYCPSIC